MIYTGHNFVLLPAGADENCKDIGDFTTLMQAAQFGQTTIAQYLIEKGANVNVKTLRTLQH
jgi:ankyrin repeat protein